MTGFICFDFDGVIADTTPHLNVHFPAVFERFLNPDGAIPNFDEFRRGLFSKYGSTLHGWAALHGYDHEWVIRSQGITNDEVGKLIMPLLQPDPELVEKIRQLQQKHKVAILTHSHRVYTLPLLSHLGMAEVFPEHLVFDVTYLKDRNKQQQETYRHVADYMQAGDAPFSFKVMLEDTVANLPAAKQEHFDTLLIAPETPVESYPYVDYTFATTHEALDHLLERYG